VGDDLPGDTTASIITAAKGAKVVQAGEDLVHTNKIVTSSFLSRLLRNMEPKAAKVANDARVEKGLSPIGKLTDAAGDAIGGSFGALQANSDIQSVVASVKRNALAKQGVGSPLAKSNRANTLDGIFNVGMTVGGSTIAGGLLPVAAATAVGTGAEVGAMATAGGLLAASFGLDATGIGAIAGLALGAGVVGYEYYTKKQSADAYQNAQSKQTKELVSSLNLPANSPTKNYIQNYLGYTADKLNSMSPTQVQNLITTGQKITKANTPVEGPPAPPTPKVGATSAPVTPKTPATALKNVPIAATQIPSPVAAVKKAVTKPTTILNTVKGDLTKGVKAVSNFFSNI
jgi:hypothetical protein